MTTQTNTQTTATTWKKSLPNLRPPKKTAWIIASILLLAAAGGFTYYRVVYLPSQTTEEPTMQTASVR